ncbi:MAG TPA: OmpA family protein [Polyangia bacterium]|jgi:peptidoglycan-associated lipoprotein|nr:OmpA family protein [Polyangia bacterium]
MVGLIASAAAALGGACSHADKTTKVDATPLARVEAPPRGPRPAPAPPVANVARASGDDAIFFDFDSALLSAEARPVLQKVATEVRHKDKEDLRVEGNCDELGTVEYNLALGDHRARAAKDYLVHLGVPSRQIQVVSYGSQRQKFSGHDDAARAKNRRDDFVLRTGS